MRGLRCLVPVITSALWLLSSTVSANSQERDRINYLSPVENPVIHTPSQRVHSLSIFDITFDLHQNQQRIKLSLQPNHDILADDAQFTFVDQEGQTTRTEPILKHHHRVFKGRTSLQLPDGRWTRVGSARVTLKEDGLHPLFEGTFSVLRDHHHVMLQSKYAHTKREFDQDAGDTGRESMIVYRDSDMGPDPDTDSRRSLPMGHSCGANNLQFNVDPNHPIFQRPSTWNMNSWNSMSLNSVFGLSKRQNDFGGGGMSGVGNLQETIGSTAGCPSTKKVALVGVATDCEYFKLHKSEQAVRENVIKVVNDASEVYESSFNITLGLRNLTVLDGSCPSTPSDSTPWNIACDGGSAIDDRLNLFSSWRADQGDVNAFWTLLTSCTSGSEVGLAWLGQLCVSGASGGGDGTEGNDTSQSVSGASVVAYTPSEWQVFAHEAGHIFGAVHDCDRDLCQDRDAVSSSQCCPFSEDTCNARSQFLMNPAASDEMTQFSACTIGNICSAMGRNSVNSDCLTKNIDVPTISGSQCGNGIVEEEEECDCGGEESCGDNPCCNPDTCTLTEGSVCDDSNAECCLDCQYASSDFVCRESNGDCDPEERCSGESSTCPEDEHSSDGEECGDGLACASGQCTSRDEQCRSLMGDMLGGNDTFSCDDSSCELRCSSPSMPRNSCSGMRQNFMDGTPCSGGGNCQNGRCEGSSVGNEITSWVDRHRPLVIGLSAGLGGLLLLSILACILRRYCRPRKRKTMAPLNNVHAPPVMYGSPPAPPAQWSGNRGAPGGWQNLNNPPQYPGVSQPQPARQSFRYA